MSARRSWLVVLTAAALLVVAAGDADCVPVAARHGHLVSTRPAWVPPLTDFAQLSDDDWGHDHGTDVAYNSQFDEYLVVWKDQDGRYSGRRVSSRGEPLGPVWLIDPASGTMYDGAPRVAYDASRNRYLVVFGRYSSSGTLRLYGRFVPWNGPDASLNTFAIDDSLPTESYAYAVAYAQGQDEYLVVWGLKVGPRAVVVGRRIRADGGFAAGTQVITSHASDNRDNPDVAYNSHRNEYLVVVDDEPNVNGNIYGVRLAGDGTALGGGEFGIAGWPDKELEPTVAACPTADQYLVAWKSEQVGDRGYGLYARLVSGAGVPGTVKELVHVPSSSDHLGQGDSACGVSSLQEDEPCYLVTWYDKRSPGPSYAREVLTDGRLSDTVQLGQAAGSPAVGGGHINFLVGFADVAIGDGDYATIYAGIVGNTKPKAAFDVTPQEGTSTTVFQFDASISSDATDPPSQLQVRWDWDNDGAYDTPWSRNKIAGRQFILESGQPIATPVVRLQVTDGQGVSDTTTQQFTVYNAPPSATFRYDPATGDNNTAFVFDASASSDPEGGALEARWDWTEDGVYDTAWSAVLTAGHTFPITGTHTVELEVRDNWGKTDATTRQVIVGQPGARKHIYLPLIVRAIESANRVWEPGLAK